MNKYIILLFNVLFLVSCSVKENKKTELIEDKVEESKIQNVFFKWPEDGSTVASPVFVDMGLNGMLIEPAGKFNKGFGHHHILINQTSWPLGSVIPMSDSTLHFGLGETDTSLELDPGNYIISLQFADGVHASYGENMSSSIKIKVE